MNARWYSLIIEEIPGARRAEKYLTNTRNEVVREVFLERWLAH